MKARTKKGKVITGKLADTLVRLNLAKPARERKEKKTDENKEVEKQPEKQVQKKTQKAKQK